MLVDVQAADGLPHRAFGERDATLPPCAQLLRAGERGAGERELRVDERCGEVRGERADNARRQPVAPGVEPVGREQAEHAGDELRLADHDGVERADGRVQAGGPGVEQRTVGARTLDERGPGGGVVRRLHIAGPNGVPVRGRDLGLEREHAIGPRLRLVETGQAKMVTRNVR